MCFIFAAMIWISIEIEFLSIVLILVYVGAVMVLFLFVVMMLNIKHEEQSRKSVWLSYVCLLIFFNFFLFYFFIFENAIDDFARTESIISNTREIGIILYTEFTYAFIIAGILLLLAVVGAIAIIIPLQEKPEKSVNPKDQ